MYRVQYKLLCNEKLVGFRCNTPVGTKDYSLDFVRKNISNFDIRIWGNGFRFKDSLKSMSDLPTINMSNRRMKIKDTGITWYTGKNLKNYCDNFLYSIFNERDFVDTIRNMLNNKKFNRVISVSGLRGVGKTVGLLQVITSLKCYNDIVFLNIDKEIDCSELKGFIDSNVKNKKYIFIDEINRVKGFLTESSFLFDQYSSNGVSVVISGTDSLGLIKSSSSALYHRVFNISCTFISFSEANRTCEMSFSEYLNMGGLYKADTISNLNDLCDYIDTAIVDNIYNTLTRNKNISSMVRLKDLVNNRKKLRTIIFKVLYAIGYSTLQEIRGIKVNQIINLFDILQNSVSDVNRVVCDDLGLVENIYVSSNEITLILQVLQDLGILYRLDNIATSRDSLYYITNPSMNNQVVYSLIKSLQNIGFDFKDSIKLNSVKGKIFESVVICHTINKAKQLGYDTYFYRAEDKEIDLIVGKIVEDEFDSKFMCFEIKMTNSIDVAVLKSKWIMDSSIYDFLCTKGEVIDRGIIYSGKNYENFKKFDNKDLYPPKNMTLGDIELKNKGVKLIPVLQYLRNMNKILSNLK